SSRGLSSQLGGTSVGESASKRSARRHRERLRALGRVTLSDVRRLRYRGLVVESLRPLAIEAEYELTALLGDKPDHVTAAERALIEDSVRLGLLAKATFAAYMQAPDPELARTVAVLSGQRRAGLVAVGLERRQRPLEDLHAFLERRAREAREAPPGA